MRALDSFYASLGAKIRSRRYELGLTQQELSQLIGLSRTSITNIERGRQRLMADQLLAVANALDTQVENLASPVAQITPGKGSARINSSEMPTVARFVNRVLADSAP